MTLLGALGIQTGKHREITAPTTIICADISIVIPVKNNQPGITRFLTTFIETHAPACYPREIIIVDNASQPPITIPKALAESALKITVLFCATPGPASARHLGIRHAQTAWVLFTDSDCIPSPAFILGYIAAMNGSIGYAGLVKAWGSDWVSQYYESQSILVPPPVDEDGITRPEYMITANSLVWRKALEVIGGFNETITIAAGEDIDLGFRLREIGFLSYAPAAYVYHDFAGGLTTFVTRFIRYGKGNKMISKLYKHDLTPKMFPPKQPSIVNWILSKIQYASLFFGYKAH